jgi:hypothetical protein
MVAMAAACGNAEVVRVDYHPAGGRCWLADPVGEYRRCEAHKQAAPGEDVPAWQQACANLEFIGECCAVGGGRQVGWQFIGERGDKEWENAVAPLCLYR